MELTTMPGQSSSVFFPGHIEINPEKSSLIISMYIFHQPNWSKVTLTNWKGWEEIAIQD